MTYTKSIISTLLLGLLCTSCYTTRSTSACTQLSDPITHVVMVWLKPETTAERRKQIEAGSLALDQIPGVYNLVVGNALESDRAIVDDSFDLALSMQFRNKTEMDAYVVHPDHKKYVDGIKPHIAKLLVYDLTPTK